MKFYNREKELEMLETLYENKPSFVVLTGKRRVGKTELIKEFSKGKKSLYLFVDSNKSRDILLAEYEEYIKGELSLPEYIRFKTPGELTKFLIDYKEDIVVAFDEFQRFLKINPSFITELQKQWDLKGGRSKVFLITLGSSVGMMKKIFIEEKAPLFKRAENIITLRPFSLKEIFKILDDLGVNYLLTSKQASGLPSVSRVSSSTSRTHGVLFAGNLCPANTPRYFWAMFILAILSELFLYPQFLQENKPPFLFPFSI